VTISEKLRQQVIIDANYCCEYCKTSSRLTGMPLVMEHILPKSQGGTDSRENLAASCYRCNEFKGVRTNAIDPETGQ
jgi:5-methylcytosine-specific restriction endonuclease McrA